MNLKSLLKSKKTSLLLLMFLLFFCIHLFTYKPPEQFIVINNNKVPLSAIPIGWDLSIIDPLQIVLCNWEFFMQDILTGKGVPDVHVSLETWALGQHGTLSVYTDVSGYAKITVIRVDQAKVTATHPKYYQRSELASSGVANMYVNWFLTPLTESQPPDQNPPPIPPDVVKLTFYSQVDKKSYVIIGGLDVEGQHYDFDRSLPQRAIMWLQKNSIHNLQVSGWYNKVERDIFGGFTGYNPINFEYTRQITTTNTDTEYWIDLQSGDVHSGTPPQPEDTGGNWVWDFIARYGLLIVGGILFLYALPHIASILRTITGRGKE